MEPGSVVRAIFDFRPSVSEELPLFVGDIIEVLNVVDEFWIYGVKDGIKGQFPSSFVECVPIPSTQCGEKLMVCTDDFTSHEHGTLSLRRGDVVTLEESIDTSWLRGRNCRGTRGIFPTSCVQKLCLSSRSRLLSKRSVSELPVYAMGQARALMGLSALLEEELDFREGDIITIIGIPEQGWFKGELDGKRGIFPEGFVELLGPLRMVDDSLNRENLSNKNDVITETESSVIEEEEDIGGLYGTALYEFRAIEEGELDFDIGDRIQIIRTLDDGWLEGEVRGRRGIFPYRFVKLENLEQQQSDFSITDQHKNFTHGEIRKDEFMNSTKKLPPLQNWITQSPEFSAFCRMETKSYTGSKALQHSVHHTDDNARSKSFSKSDDLHEIRSYDTRQITDAAAASNSCFMATDHVPPKPRLPPRPRRPPLLYSKLDTNSIIVQTHLKVNEKEEDVGASLPVACGVLPFEDKETFTPHVAPSHWTPAEKHCFKIPKEEDGEVLRHSSSGATRIPKENGIYSKGTVYQDLTKWMEECRLKETDKNCSFTPSPHSQQWNFNLTSESPTADSGSSQSLDLESKLTEQLQQFERSLPSPIPGESKKVSRHFSILDYSSKNDILLGYPQSSSQQGSLERRRALRPPPPRPNSRGHTSPVHERSNRDKSPILMIRPSRPPPLPPPSVQRRTAASPKYEQKAEDQAETVSSWQSLALEEHSDTDEVHVQHETCGLRVDPEVTVSPFEARIQAIEKDLELYSKTWEELSLMLDGCLDETIRSETLENLEFCSCNMETLRTELQQLKEMTLLSTHPSSSESSQSASVSSENPEQRMMEKRSKVIEELLQTERDYIRDLQMCVDKVLLPLQRKQLQNVDFDGLFGNIQMVIEVSQQLLKDLEDADNIGPVFLEHKVQLEEVYKIYCQNHTDSTLLLDTYEKDESIQKHFLECLETLRGKTNYINFGSFLIKPVQRIMRYPMLLMELLNTTPSSHGDKRPLSEAVVAVKGINVNINEHKRRKDLVVKYRRADEDSLMDKISKLNMHSILKKSSRVSSHIKHLTGFSLQVKDENFDEQEKNFRLQERLIKSFVRDVSLYLQHIRESSSVTVLAAMSLCDLYADTGNQNLTSYQSAYRHISEKLFNDFSKRTDCLVSTPLNQLLAMFAGPHKLIQKRFDKLLDYNNCIEKAEKLKDKKTQDELQTAKNNYEALNAQLLDELPKFQQSVLELLVCCVRSFAEGYKDFVHLTLERLKPLIQLAGIEVKDGNNIALFLEEHNKVMQQLQLFSFFPESLPTSRKPFERKSTERQSTRKNLLGPLYRTGSCEPNYVLQTEQHKASLLTKYPPEKLYQADRNFNAAQELDVSLLEGDLVGVIKQQDPMGSQNRWLIDNGVTKGFVYSSFLKPYNPRCSQSNVSVGSHSSGESGYGGSSPVLSRQNSNSTLTFNPGSTVVAYCPSSTPQHPGSESYSHSDPFSTLNVEPCTSKLSKSRDVSFAQQSGDRDTSYWTDQTDWCTLSYSQTVPGEQLGSKETAQQGSLLEKIADIANRTGTNSQINNKTAFYAETETTRQSEPKENRVYYAIYSFKARCSNELSVSANQRLKILEFHDIRGNKEWWLAESEGKQGYVPSNYIRKTEYT
ncbi:dynamin-binding protein isoform X2 [Protopterus annectens]|uniref:dynamin-binding protein isoform X2 n=1 Tax=Protopterus annectens TaxID=7888 RepID=UPI001CF94093|nr:dynamin-binding protein isoform X2 [Protopterus annectens]